MPHDEGIEESGPICWGITRGAYSDWNVEGVYLTKAEAEAALAEIEARYADDVKGTPGYSDYSLTELPLGRIDERSGCYVAELDAFGNATSCRWEDFAHERPAYAIAAREPSVIDGRSGRPLTFIGTGKTREHARRSASELWRALKAGTITLKRGGFDWRGDTLVPA